MLGKLSRLLRLHVFEDKIQSSSLEMPGMLKNNHFLGR